MSQMVELEFFRRTEALLAWAQKCRQAMAMRWPDIEFYADTWPLNTRYQTKLLDVRFKPTRKAFADQDEAYLLAYRCLIAHIALDGRLKTWRTQQDAWCLLRETGAPLAGLARDHLIRLERNVLQAATPASSTMAFRSLVGLSRMLDTLATRGAATYMAWSPSVDTYDAFLHLKHRHRRNVQETKTPEIIDRKIEALSDATYAMLAGDTRLNDEDRSAIAIMNIMMCAPSRINESLCLRVDDRFTVADYLKRPEVDAPNELYQAHQLLLMKGSKGAASSGKPILNFMIGLAEACWQVILAAGQRSRMLLQHYENQPNRLFLPRELEHLRGTPITHADMWQITNLTAEHPPKNIISYIWDQISKSAEVDPVPIPNPRAHSADGRSKKPLKALPWSAVESYLLEKIQERMDQMRRVTSNVTYEGPLSRMLTLVDRKSTPYLPSAWKDFTLRSRFTTYCDKKRRNPSRSVFRKLDLKMMVRGELVECSIESHDARRWLTTQALQAGDRLSDVLINKWANRLDLGQLSAYDLRTEEQTAEQSAMPVPPSLQALGESLTELQSLGQSIDLKTDFVRAHGDDLVVTDLHAIEQCAETRPTARCGSEIVILTPTRYGVCLHQHHKAPCLSYKNCDRCSLLAVCKGHKPTNDAWRSRQARTNQVILSEVERHILAHNRGIADDIESLESHILKLLDGVGAQAITKELIDRYQEVKGLIHNSNFRRRLEQAYTSYNVVQFLENPDIPNGSLIRYNNPGMHDDPGHERAMESRLGAREDREKQMGVYYEQHPEFAPRPLELSDQSASLLGFDEDDEETNQSIEDNDEQVA